jgi:hypothetical protein
VYFSCRKHIHHIKKTYKGSTTDPIIRNGEHLYHNHTQSSRMTRIIKISSFIIRDCERKEAGTMPIPMLRKRKFLYLLNITHITSKIVLKRKNIAGANTIRAFLNLTILSQKQILP